MTKFCDSLLWMWGGCHGEPACFQIKCEFYAWQVEVSPLIRAWHLRFLLGCFTSTWIKRSAKKKQAYSVLVKLRGNAKGVNTC